MDENKRNELAELFKELRDRKKELDEQVKALNAEIESVQSELIADLTEHEDGGFNHKGYNYTLVLTEHHSANAETRDGFYAVLKERGRDDLFTVNAKKLQGQVTEWKNDNDGQLPEWLDGYINTYEKPSIRVTKGRKV